MTNSELARINIVKLLIAEAEKASAYLKNCKYIEVYKTGVPWPSELERVVKMAKEAFQEKQINPAFAERGAGDHEER